ncbi:isocitrate lyase/phosphoenolpyruvate mutase family protein [Lederbergia citrisecunda]|nr:isocitrate lyase/phosphoenolpyruvate mutase family protein [Lederbergia citrisecunda]
MGPTVASGIFVPGWIEDDDIKEIIMNISAPLSVYLYQV